MTWTKADLDKLKLKNNFKERKPKNNILSKKYIENGKISHEKETIKTVLWLLKRECLFTEFVEELKFCEHRKFRFDWAIPEYKIAIEFEGINSNKSRHTTITGYSNDCTKYNEAQKLGWVVFRYTILNYTNIYKDLSEFIVSLKSKTVSC